MSIEEIQVAEEPSERELIKSIVLGLRSYNRTFIGDTERKSFVMTARDSEGSLVGGLICEVGRGWLWVDVLWVAEKHRGRGLGSRLLQSAEKRAQAEGATRAHLDTFTFQAVPFYQRHGYEEFGRIKEFAPGHDRVYLVKRIGPTEPGPATS